MSRIFAILILLFLSAAPAQADVLDYCSWLLKVTTGNDALTEQRAKTFLPQIKEQNQKQWQDNLNHPPELASGLTAEKAIELLTKVRDSGQWPKKSGESRGWNEVQLGDGHVALIKANNRRTDLDSGRVASTYAEARWEAIMFAIDRYLGSNVVPPAVALDSTTVAILKLPTTRNVSYKKADADPARLVDMTHIRLLDLLARNNDREFPGNLMEQEDGRLTGIDFDLSRPHGAMHVEAALHALSSQRTLIEPERRLGKYGKLPGVFSRKVVDRLSTLDGPTIIKVVRETVGANLSEDEAAAMASSAYAALAAIRRWETQYGTDLIIPIR